MILRTIYESIVQAGQQLASNKLRSFLSLSGIVIGIICIISVLSAVDSLKENISASFEKLGNDVVYVSKQPWNEDPNQNWWKYLQRPEPSYNDMIVIKKKSKLAAKARIHPCCLSCEAALLKNFRLIIASSPTRMNVDQTMRWLTFSSGDTADKALK